MAVRKDFGEHAAHVRRDRQAVRVRVGDGLVRGFTHQLVRAFQADLVEQ